MLTITQTVQNYNPFGDIKRLGTYSIKDDGKKVVRAAAKEKLGLRAKRVSNGPLFNNPSLSQGVVAGTQLCTVGLVFRGAERKYQVPVIWDTDKRGNYRRYITKEQFKKLPTLLQVIAKSRGVNTNSNHIIFSRCVMAWAGFNVKDMHVHHVTMDTTDDRLGNLWVLSVSDHASIHNDRESLFWDEDWYEYTSMNVLELCCNRDYLQGEDIAMPITHTMPPLYSDIDTAYNQCNVTYGNLYTNGEAPSTYLVWDTIDEDIDNLYYP
jgi:hypothetical protein